MLASRVLEYSHQITSVESNDAQMVVEWQHRKDVLETLQVNRKFRMQTLTFCVTLVIMFYWLFVFSDIDLSYYFS